VERVDVLVVGGGPAGSSVAWGLRDTGLRVRVVDRADFPRDKTCAGWVTPPVFHALALDPKDYAAGGRTLQPIRGFQVGRLGSAASRVCSREVISHGIRRCEFDAFLLRRSGAELRLGEAVRTLERRANGWLVNGQTHARLLVGAGGHFCPVARRLEAGQAKEVPIAAQEIEVELSGEDALIAPDVPEIWFCADLQGYGWAFRKGRFLNVGLGRRGGAGLSEHVQSFLDGLRRTGRIPETWHGRAHGHAYLTYGSTRRPLAAPGVALVGDAAGLAYPRSGEGIRPAVESGLLLARALAGAADPADPEALARYEAHVVARLGPRTPAEPGRTAAWQAALAGRLFALPWFARRVVVERWFLNRHVAALAPCAPPHDTPRQSRQTGARLSR
jgi:flavin-dependent dehydrogenase